MVFVLVKGYLRKGACLLAIKDCTRAAESYLKALDIDPDCNEALEGYKRFVLEHLWFFHTNNILKSLTFNYDGIEIHCHVRHDVKNLIHSLICTCSVPAVFTLALFDLAKVFFVRSNYVSDRTLQVERRNLQETLVLRVHDVSNFIWSHFGLQKNCLVFCNWLHVYNRHDL